MSSASGISELMAAEAKATKIVEEARAGRATRMREAKSESDLVIQQYRKEKETAFMASMNEVAIGGLDLEGLDKDTDKEIATLKSQYSANSGAVVKMLMDKVCDITFKPPAKRVV